MQIIKNINNNFAIAIDNSGNKLIVSGKGIGFGKVPRKIEDITKIDRSYYDVDDVYVSMINNIPEEIIAISNKIIDQARLLINNPISSNIVFTLADHIQFCIQRYEKNMDVKLPIVYDIQHFFEKEMCIGEYGLKLIRKKLNINLPKEEATYIALHIINAEEKRKNTNLDEDNKIIENITKIIEEEYGLKINKESFNYSRFVTHMHYLLKRSKNNQLIDTVNKDVYEKLKEDYQKTYQCVRKVTIYLNSELKIKLSSEEKLYLILHINRLCSREDCNQ